MVKLNQSVKNQLSDKEVFGWTEKEFERIEKSQTLVECLNNYNIKYPYF